LPRIKKEKILPIIDHEYPEEGEEERCSSAL
jgi:hypothetical protein